MGDPPLPARRVWRTSAVCLAAAVTQLAVLPAVRADEATEFFETSVRPLLLARCTSCHGAEKQWSGLRLDGAAGIRAGGDNGPVIVPGDVEASRLVAAIRRDGDLQMPPDEPLAAAEVAVLEAWVRGGGQWPSIDPGPADTRTAGREHWSFQPVARVVPPPPVAGWPEPVTPVDAFVQTRLADAGLEPAEPADRRTLIRRLSYDLTGLPPTAADVEAFVADPSADAYDRLVERLLDSPHAGEQLARRWLDVARYSDTKGYVYGREERVWVHAHAYRDWVVRAFNDDMPYDRFLLLQLAADQVAPEDPAAAAAMGFLTLGRRFLGVTHEIIDDRIDVVTRATMGLTVACARCHDHKYDPIPTSDYYALYGVFLNCTEDLVSIGGARPPATPAELEAVDTELASRLAALRDALATKREEAAARVRGRITDYLVAQTELDRYPEEGFDQILATTDVIPTFVRRFEGFLGASARRTDPVFAPWVALAALPPAEFALRAGSAVGGLAAGGIVVNPRIAAALEPPPATMREVAERYGAVFAAVEREWQAVVAGAKERGEPAPERLADDAAESVRRTMYAADSPCLVPDEPIVSTEGFFDSDSCTQLWKLQGEVDRWLIQQPLAPTYAVRLVDRAIVRPARVFRRGDPKLKAAEVPRRFLTLLAGKDAPAFATGSGRLELARAIIDPANPLTPRVWVNRLWQQHFGRGLVDTPSDFGVRAAPPSHPELLDWLAGELVANGWSTKHIQRLIVRSATYRQRSDAARSPAVAERAAAIDPADRLLWRMTSRRLSFEEYRDTLLAVAGRLDPGIGGRAVDMFAGDGLGNQRRSLYGLVDRQFLPSVLRVFDFANPDLHVPRRSETTVPQQALFSLNHPFVAGHARALVARVAAEGVPQTDQVRALYQAVYQRPPTPAQDALAQAFLAADVPEPGPPPRIESRAWSYGYGRLDETTGRLESFTHLPHFTGTAWQGGEQWPGGGLGWAQLTATGGHTGDDLAHSVIRRWTAPHDGRFTVSSTAIHETSAGDGVRCHVVSSRGGRLASVPLHDTRLAIDVGPLDLVTGDTLDFVVDVGGGLNNDQHLWAPVIRDLSPVAGRPAEWDATRDFDGPPPARLSRLEQLAQVLLISNETLFVD